MMAAKLLTSASALLLLLALQPTNTAEAGPLAQTARAVDNKTSSDDDSSSSSSRDSNTVDHRDSNTVDHRDDDDDDNYSASSSSSLLVTGGGGQATCYDCDDAAELHLGPPSGHARLAGQKVRDSDGSFRFDATILFGQVGAYVSADYYFEHIEAKAADGLMEDNVRVNLFEIAPIFQVFNNGPLTADLRIGFSAAASSHFDTLPGAVMGVRLQAHANDLIALSLEGRAMAYRDDVVAYEGVVGAQYSIAWLGYRALKFDVGPALEGPEAGLRFAF
tara:strand:+ start:84341 stop:85168 length:828 start_codon:yes stop_codon:yes gene_type:complete